MINIAIDGPGGAGKSTVARALAEKLGIMYLDTGAMYRAAALKAFDCKTDVKDASAVEKLTENLDIEVRYANGEQKIFLDGKDVSKRIREHFVSALASDISAVPALRLWLVDLQRAAAEKFDCVLDGRDIGSFVLPDATLKIYLTADVRVRARRRTAELESRGQKAAFESVLEDLETRDRNDMTRAFAPLKKAEDAVIVDSTDMTVDEVVDKIEKMLKQRLTEI